MIDSAWAAWVRLRRDGPLSLLSAASTEARAAVPFRYRIRIRTRLQRLRWGDAAVDDPLCVFSVDPSRIRHESQRFERASHIGTVRGGDWDRDRAEWGGTTFEGLKQRFVDGRRWSETALYRHAKRRIETAGYYHGYTDFETFRSERLPYLDRLFERIREDGYRTQAELSGDGRDRIRHPSAPDHHVRTHEIGCNIGRDGGLLFNSGTHRLAIAKLLDLDAVPIQVIVRHEGWMERRRAVATTDDPEDALADWDAEPAHFDLQELSEEV